MSCETNGVAQSGREPANVQKATTDTPWGAPVLVALAAVSVEPTGGRGGDCTRTTLITSRANPTTFITKYDFLFTGREWDELMDSFPSLDAPDTPPKSSVVGRVLAR